MEYQMTKLPVIAFTALVAAAGLAAPALAATSVSTPDKVPYCATGNTTDYDSQMDTLATQLQLSTKQGASIDVWGGCIKVTTLQNGKAVMAFYDPDSLKLVATIG
jgi:hypothetical protein